MNIDTFGVYVRAELDHWGHEFALHLDCEYLGHQSKNLLAVLIEHGGDMPGRAQGYKPLETDLRAQRIEDIVAHIWRSHRDMAIVLRAYYCGSGRRKNERWETANLLLANAGSAVISKTGYMELVRRGEDRVRGFIEGMGFAQPLDRSDLRVA